jgi:hypothetical protein
MSINVSREALIGGLSVAKTATVGRFSRPLNRCCQHYQKARGKYLFSAFKKSAHHFAAVPAEDDYLGWLALMRHHGAPSRLLYWTLSVTYPSAAPPLTSAAAANRNVSLTIPRRYRRPHMRGSIDSASQQLPTTEYRVGFV